MRFRKGGDLRFLSHRDLLRLFERSARSAGLPLAYTEGFHPHPRIAIVQALTLGVTGEAEVCEVDLAAPIAPEALREAWQRQMPEGFAWVAAREVRPGGAPARVITAHWRVRFPAPADLAARVDALLAAPTAIVVRALPPPPREVDVRHALESCTVVPEGVAFALRLDADGSARPDEVLRALGCTPDPADVETVRTGLDLADETGLDWGRRTTPTLPGGARRVATVKPADKTGPDAWPREFKLSDLAE